MRLGCLGKELCLGALLCGVLAHSGEGQAVRQQAAAPRRNLCLTWAGISSAISGAASSVKQAYPSLNVPGACLQTGRTAAADDPLHRWPNPSHLGLTLDCQGGPQEVKGIGRGSGGCASQCSADEGQRGRPVRLGNPCPLCKGAHLDSNKKPPVAQAATLGCIRHPSQQQRPLSALDAEVCELGQQERQSALDNSVYCAPRLQPTLCVGSSLRNATMTAAAAAPICTGSNAQACKATRWTCVRGRQCDWGFYPAT